MTKLWYAYEGRRQISPLRCEMDKSKNMNSLWEINIWHGYFDVNDKERASVLTLGDHAFPGLNRTL